MRLYGNESCASCRMVKMLLQKYGIPFEDINVMDIPGFSGEIPQLELDNGIMLIGPGEVMRWIYQKGR